WRRFGGRQSDARTPAANSEGQPADAGLRDSRFARDGDVPHSWPAVAVLGGLTRSIAFADRRAATVGLLSRDAGRQESGSLAAVYGLRRAAADVLSRQQQRDLGG